MTDANLIEAKREIEELKQQRDDLLAACKRMAVLLRPDVEPMEFERDATLNMARAAIARAEGQ